MFSTHSQIYTVLLVLFIILQTTLSSDYYDPSDYNYGHEHYGQEHYGHEHYGHESEPPAIESPEQNSTSADVELRNQLCGPETGNLDRFYQRTGKCYRTSTRGPCGNNMILYGQPNNQVYGTCDCATSTDKRTLIYHRGTSQCYLIFTEAYCPQGQWLTISRSNGLPICETNPCLLNSNNDQVEYVHLNGKCVALGSSCGEEGQIVTFQENFISPRCEKSFASGGVGYALGVLTPKCSPGTSFSYSGKCLRNWVW